jgi:hypothetical protein
MNITHDDLRLLEINSELLIENNININDCQATIKAYELNEYNKYALQEYYYIIVIYSEKTISHSIFCNKYDMYLFYDLLKLNLKF